MTVQPALDGTIPQPTPARQRADDYDTWLATVMPKFTEAAASGRTFTTYEIAEAHRLPDPPNPQAHWGRLMTTRPYGARRPLTLRTTTQHPARATRCPHCHANPGQPCTTRTGHRLPAPHPARLSEHAQATACCPTCQVAPGTPCHDHGRPRPTVHARRYQEADDAARLKTQEAPR